MIGKLYLGDNIYADNEHDMIILTSEKNGINESIYLERGTMLALLEYWKAVQREKQ